jgi:hypothetical protein
MSDDFTVGKITFEKNSAYTTFHSMMEAMGWTFVGTKTIEEEEVDSSEYDDCEEDVMRGI